MTLEDKIKTHNQRVEDKMDLRISELEGEVIETLPKVQEILKYANLCRENGISIYKFTVENVYGGNKGMGILREGKDTEFRRVGFRDSANLHSCYLSGEGQITVDSLYKPAHIEGMETYLSNFRVFYNNFLQFIEEL